MKHFAGERRSNEEPAATGTATLTSGAIDLAALQLQGAALGALPQLQLQGLAGLTGGLAGFQGLAGLPMATPDLTALTQQQLGLGVMPALPGAGQV